MSFNEIVQNILDRLNLTSDTARLRVEDAVNRRYRQVTSSIGLITSRRVRYTITVDASNLTLYPDLPDLRIVDLEKVLRLSTTGSAGGITTIKQVTYEEVTSHTPFDRIPHAWAVKEMGAGYVIVTFESVPTTPFSLIIEGYDVTDTLADEQEPILPTDFHDILIEGAMSDELNKMEKPALAQIHEQKFEARLSDLRMFIAKSAWMDLYQGKSRPTSSYYWPWFVRSTDLGIE